MVVDNFQKKSPPVENLRKQFADEDIVYRMRLRKLRNRLNPLVLVTASLALALLVVFYLQLARPVPEVLVAKQDLAEGTEISISDFDSVGIDLGLASDAYFSVDQFPAGGILARSIAAGEVLARSQVSQFSTPGYSVIKFKPELPIAESLQIGDQVSVWVVSGEQFEQLDPAVQISLGRLISVQPGEGLFADELPFVEISIPELTLPEVLKSMAAADRVYLVEPGT